MDSVEVGVKNIEITEEKAWIFTVLYYKKDPLSIT